jgi:hypothetical protein
MRDTRQKNRPSQKPTTMRTQKRSKPISRSTEKSIRQSAMSISEIIKLSIIGGEKVNNYEKIQSMSLEDLAHFLCEIEYEANDCSHCPHKDRCFPHGVESHNGYMNWLEETAK